MPAVDFDPNAFFNQQRNQLQWNDMHKQLDAHDEPPTYDSAEASAPKEAPKVVIVIKGQVTAKEADWLTKDLRQRYGDTVFALFATADYSVTVHGCETVEATSLAGVVDQIVDKYLTEDEAQQLYQSLYAKGHRIK